MRFWTHRPPLVSIRDDSQYKKQVAVKLIRTGQDFAFVIQRFRNERQILASFDHPNIARLLDGGTTHEGLPYFVMELIDGEPIDRYCDRKKLDVNERLRLFLDVCGAVQYAHQRLIIHRDLKPTNILVSEDGAPKLLDFGIAKILEHTAAAAASMDTKSAFRLLTPYYASPEQFTGEPITTASDVYSLGLVLYELLTGLKPYDASERTPLTLPRSAQDWEPRKPSAAVRRAAANSANKGVADSRDPEARSAVREGSPQKLSRRLRGDLDNIVLMSLRRDPARRYESVELFAEDLRRHLSSHPVLARTDTLAYRTAKFIARYRVGVSAAAVLALGLVAGLIVTTHETRIAQNERARAERRFADVRRLAHSLIFDINDSIQNLPGSMAARHLILKTGMQYLDSLSQEAAGDPSLQHEIAAAYERLGDVQGHALEANEGDNAGAADSYRRALELRRSVILAQPGNFDVLRELVVNYGKLSDLMWNSAKPDEALAYSKQTVSNSEFLASSDPTNRGYQALLATSRLDLGFKLFKIQGDSVRGLQNVREALTALQSAWAADKSKLRAGRTLSLAYSRAAEILSDNESGRAEALSLDQEARKLLGTLFAAAPNNADFAHLMAFSDHDIAGVLIAMGDLDRAEQEEAAALKAFRTLTNADPKIGEYHIDVALALAALADIAVHRGNPALALPQLEEALRESALAESAAGTANVNFQLAKAIQQRQMGEVNVAFASKARRTPARQLRYWQSAKDWYRKAAETFDGLRIVSHEAATNAEQIAAKIRQCDAELLNLGYRG